MSNIVQLILFIGGAVSIDKNLLTKLDMSYHTRCMDSYGQLILVCGTAREAAKAMGVSEQAFYKWGQRDRIIPERHWFKASKLLKAAGKLRDPVYMQMVCVLCGETFSGFAQSESCKECARYAWRMQQRTSAKVANAVRKNQLPHPKTQKCADCGKPATGYDHRLYCKPLEVDPICHSCNRVRGPALDLYAPLRP